MVCLYGVSGAIDTGYILCSAFSFERDSASVGLPAAAKPPKSAQDRVWDGDEGLEGAKVCVP